jgi:hypothetical protein
MVTIVEDAPIFDRVANDQAMNKYLLLLQDSFGIVATDENLEDVNYLTDPMDTIVSLTFAVMRRISIPQARVRLRGIPLVIP